jgi:hypothetical protein
MKYVLNNLEEIKNKTRFLEEDINGRKVDIFSLNEVSFVGSNLYYPNVLAFSNNSVYRVIDETIMSLKHVNNECEVHINHPVIQKTETTPVFFFVYNTENYYHFVYDTLPYLISFKHLQKSIPIIKLLMNFPNTSKTNFYKFVIEFLELLGIKEEDIILIDKHTLYKSVYISDSFTHGKNSNTPPRTEIYDFYKSFPVTKNENLPSKIYVSRRSWLHGNFSNIGTNYTTRRKLINEDQLIDTLTKKGFVEVFTENMSISEKISLFSNAKQIVGSIGGGLCNTLFGNKDCKLFSINSPEFININGRFEFSFEPVTYIPFNKTQHTEDTKLKTFMRVKIGDIVGEIVNIDGEKVTISYANAPVAGWNSETTYNKLTVFSSECALLDAGLNSPWSMDIDEFVNLLDSYE